VKSLDAGQDAISAAVAGATPEQMVQLRQAEAELQAKLQEMGFQHVEELEKIAESDRESARARQIAVKDRVPGLLAVGVTLGFFGTLGVVGLHGVVDKSRDLVNIMLGSLGTAWVAVVQYYFGSSAGMTAKRSCWQRNEFLLKTRKRVRLFHRHGSQFAARRGEE